MDTIEEIQDKLEAISEGSGVRIEGLPDHYAFRLKSGQRIGDFIGRYREHGFWPLSERNLKLAELDALHEPTRFEV